MENTEIPADRTAGEVVSILVQAGARQIQTDYSDALRISGLRFVFLVQEIPLSFALPVRTEAIYLILSQRRKGKITEASQALDRNQADRVAWRQLLRWVEAQLAMIETGMVQAQEVFLPYLLQAGTDRTLFEHFQTNGFKQLTAAKAGR